jgi:hypothetical protein
MGNPFANVPKAFSQVKRTTNICRIITKPARRCSAPKQLLTGTLKYFGALHLYLMLKLFLQILRNPAAAFFTLHL